MHYYSYDYYYYYDILPLITLTAKQIYGNQAANSSLVTTSIHRRSAMKLSKQARNLHCRGNHGKTNFFL
jgi:hypothetical protein